MDELRSDHYDLLISLFPNKDKQFLKLKSETFKNDDAGFRIYVQNQFSGTSTEYIPDDPKLDSNVKFEIDWSFKPEDFALKYYPDPYEIFKNCIKSTDTKANCVKYMQARYKDHDAGRIETVVKNKEYCLIEADSVLSDEFKQTQYDIVASRTWANNIQPTETFIDEVKFVENKKMIDDYLEMKEATRAVAKLEGELLSCECCYGEDILPIEMLSCSEGHIFCAQCVKTYVEVLFGQNKIHFDCLAAECDGKLPMYYIKKVLNSQAYLKLMAKIQEAEIRAANIPGIEYCKFCEYAVIPLPEDKVFKCVRCNVEICRLCKKLNHIPYKCGETERQDLIKRRRLNAEENKTAKLVRVCPSCKVEIVKSGGCNVIKCRCGINICHKCRREIVGLEDEDPHMHKCTQK